METGRNKHGRGACELDHITKLDQVLCDQGRSREWVAFKTGVSYSTVYRWCNGERVLPPARVPELAELLGVHESDVIGPVQKVRVA